MNLNLLFIISISLLFISFGAFEKIPYPIDQKVAHVESDTSNTKRVLVYNWINTPSDPKDNFGISDLNNVLGPVKFIEEFVMSKNDSMQQKVRAASYDLNRNLSMILYYLGHDITSDAVLESKDTNSFFWQYKFVYRKTRLKEEIRIICEDDGKIISNKVSKKESILQRHRPIIKKDKKTGHITQYRILNEGTSYGSETVFCEYDDSDRKTKETVKDSTGKINRTNKIQYFDTKIIVMTYYSSNSKKETIYKLDNYGNWIEKTISYPNNKIYGTNNHKRIITYY